MTETYYLVADFHRAFDRYIATEPHIPKNKELIKLRIRLLKEELQELEDAIKANNLVEVLDALTDLQYILDGTYLTFGLDSFKLEAFQEVHRSNMSKLGVDGKPMVRADGKILKGPNYFKPALAKLFQFEEGTSDFKKHLCAKDGDFYIGSVVKCDGADLVLGHNYRGKYNERMGGFEILLTKDTVFVDKENFIIKKHEQPAS